MSIPVRLRALNFFYFSLFALFLSYLPLYGHQIGIPETGIGFILGAGSLISLFSQPIWGIASDRLQTIRKVLLPLLAAGTLVGSLLYRTEEMWGYFFFVVLMYVFFLPTDPLIESLNYQTAQRLNVNYGSIRMFGALGYAAASLTAGFVSDVSGMQSISWLFLGSGLAALLIGLTVSDVSSAGKPPAFQQLAAFFREPHPRTFFLLVLVVAISHKMNDLFLGIHIRNLGGDMRLNGLAWFMMTIAETIFFALSSRWIKPGREAAVMTAAAAVYALRFLLSAEISEPWLLVALQILQGVTFVLFYVGGIQYVHRISPEQWKSTGQTAFTVVFFGVSGIVGSSLGGWILDAYGGVVLYRVMAAIALLGLLLFRIFLLPLAKKAE